MGREEWWGAVCCCSRRSRGGRAVTGPQVCREYTSDSRRSTRCLQFFVPLNQALARGCPGLCLFAGQTSRLPGGELLWPKNEWTWERHGLRLANTKIDLFPQPFYSAHNGITRPRFLCPSNNNGGTSALLGASLFEGWEG